MGRVIQMRDFPEDLNRRAKVQAAKEGISIKALVNKVLTAYLKKVGG